MEMARKLNREGGLDRPLERFVPLEAALWKMVAEEGLGQCSPVIERWC